MNPVQHFIYVKPVLIFSSNLGLSLPKCYLSKPLCELPPLYWNNRCLSWESYETDTVDIYRGKIIRFCVHYWLLIDVDTWIRNMPCSRSTNAQYLTCGFFWNTLQDFSVMYSSIMWRCGPTRAMASSFLRFFWITHNDASQSVGLL